MAEDCTPLTPSGGCDVAGLHLQSTGKRLPKDTGGGHEFVTELPETGDDGVEYVLMDDISDCSTYRGTFVYNKDCGGWIQTSGSGGGTIERYTFEQTPNGWRAKRNNTVIFTYVDKDTIDSYENTADGFQITRNGVVIFTHTDGGGGKTYTIESTSTGWVFKEDGTVKFTYTEPANDPSDGTYFTSGTLTTAITGTTTVAASSVTGLALADVVIGETLIYDEAGTVGRVTAVNGTNLTVETITTAPGERRGTRLGAVDDYTDLPATCAAAVALGWQTPLAGDFTYVREDTSHDSHLTEWVISSIDSSCNITWGYSHTLNAGNYVLDIYKYGDYPSGSPIPKNPDGSVTLPKDADTKYDFENLMNGSDIIGWRVKDHETGTVLYTYTDLNDNDTYTFEDVTVSGNVVGWRVKDKNGTVIYTYTDLNDKSDGTYFTSTTLDTDITDTTTVAASTVTGLTLSDVVIGETLIYDGDGTVGRVTAVTGTNLTVETITVSGSGDASSYVYKTTGTLDTTVDNTVNLALSTLSNSAGTTPTASDIIIGKTLAWDADGTVALAVAISGTDVTFKTITVAGAGGGSVTYLVDDNGDELLSVYASLDSDQSLSSANTIVAMKKRSGTMLQPSTGLFTVPDGVRVEMKFTHASSGPKGDIIFGWYNDTDGVWITDRNGSDGLKEYCPYSNTPTDSGYQMGGTYVIQWENKTGHNVNISLRARIVSSNMNLRGNYSGLSITEISRVVDPIKYLDNSEGLQDTPVGNIISYMGNNVHRHYLACDGTIYNIGDYPALEAHFVEEFGRVNYFGGNGTTTWAVPDLQGEFLRGTGTNSHTNQGSGANVGVHQDATEMPYMQGSSGNLGGRTKDSNTTHEVLAEYKNVDSQFGAPGNLKYASGFTNNVSNLTPDFTARPTNTSVKYCIKYESTMQVILGNEQYKEKATLSYTLTRNTMTFPTLTHADGDTMIGSVSGQGNAFVAPVDGWYSVSFFIPETADVSGVTYHACYLYKNGAVVGGQERDDNSNDLRVPMNCTTTIRLKKGDNVAWAWYWSGTFTNTYTRTGEANFVLLTSSVDINEVNLIAADDVYSTDEQLVGSYLGKPMYKKTYPLSSTTNNMDGVNVSSLGIENMVEIKAYCDIVASGQVYQLGINHNTGTTGVNYVSFNKTGNALHGVCTNTATTKKWREVTIWYTKTSDTAGSAPNKNSLLLTRPDLWTPGTEYDFGGGLYGQRFVRTTATATVTQYILQSGVSKIVSYGGTEWRTADGYGHPIGCSPGGTGGQSYPYLYIQGATMKSGTGNLSVWGSNITMQGWDIWVTYRK